MTFDQFLEATSSVFQPSATLTNALSQGLAFERLGNFFDGSSNFGKGLVYMIERVQETLNIK